MNHQSRAAEKARLIQQIQQQRQQLAQYKAQWVVKTQHIDKGWRRLSGLRNYVIVGTGLLVWYSARRPNKLFKFVRNMFMGVESARVARKALTFR